MERRLAAILIADMVGYSRLIRADEDGTILALRTLRQEVIDPKIEAHRGRIVKLTGDGLLLEFASVVDAVTCGAELQQHMVERNAGTPEAQQIVIRVGVNLGDVVIDGDDIQGDGVNMAARLETLSVPGGMCISGAVHEQVRDRLDLEFEDLGEQEVKNIDRPVQVWGWSPSCSATVCTGADTPRPYGAGGTSLSLPDKPSIAVLPFDNMSGDLEQEYFSDGMTEDIITALARLRWLFVIARNSTFTYKGKPVEIKQVGREMGVRYVLEGSVRKVGQRVRVTAQLIEAESGNHLWAERYDRGIVDIFNLQDDLTQAICANVNAELAGNERQMARKKTSADLDAWDYYQRGMWHFYKIDRDNMAEARRLLLYATEFSGEFASAYAGLAFIAYVETIFGYAQDRVATLQQGLRDAEMALMLDDRDDFAQFALGRVCTLLGDRERAISALERSIDLNPNSALSCYGLGMALHWFGQAKEAIPLITRAIRLSPHDPYRWGFHHLRSLAHSNLNEPDLAIIEAKAAIQAKGDAFWAHLSLAYACSSLGRSDEARAAYNRACQLEPELSASYIRTVLSTMHPPYVENWLDGLRKAGLPED